MAFRGVNTRPLMESEIKAAQAISKSGADAADKLLVCYDTYKKYAKRYGLFEQHRNQGGKGQTNKRSDPNKGKYPIDDLIKGLHPHYPRHKYIKKLFQSGYKLQECEECGFREKRVGDNKVPLTIDYIDGDEMNTCIENIRILCLCHSFLFGNSHAGDSIRSNLKQTGKPKKKKET